MKKNERELLFFSERKKVKNNNRNLKMNVSRLKNQKLFKTAILASALPVAAIPLLATAILVNPNNSSVLTNAEATYFNSSARVKVVGKNLSEKSEIEIVSENKIVPLKNVSYLEVTPEQLTLNLEYENFKGLNDARLRIKNSNAEIPINFKNIGNSTSSDSNSNKEPNNSFNSDSDLPNTNLSTSNDMWNLSTFMYKDIASYPRTVNSEYYETQMNKKYSQYGFEYPRWNNDYNEEKNRFITLPSGEKVNVRKELFKERVVTEDGSSYKYSDSNFIKSEIENNRLKKHPASNNLFETQVNPETKAVTREFTIGTSVTGNSSLGLYAPAGEIITLNFDDETFDKILRADSWNNDSFYVHINDGYWDNYDEDNSGRISNRYPFMRSTFNVDKKNKTFQFASPIGGSISIVLNSKLIDNRTQTSEPIKFTVSGAVPQLYYVEGQTTELQWNKMLEDVKDGKITAPDAAFQANFYSFSLQFNRKDELAYVKLDEIIYPKAVMKKWFEFHYLSQFITNKDLRENGRRRVFWFNNDVWNWAYGFGTGHWLAVPLADGGSGFLKGPDNFGASQQWGLMHEINHAYEHDEAFFTKRTHQSTNQVTVASLSILNNKTRYRNPFNLNGEFTSWWDILTSNFASINHVLKYGPQDEYSIYALLLYLMGSKNYFDYARKDAIEHPSVGGLEEIIRLSEFTGYNLWPAFQRFTKYWDDGWPPTYDAASPEQKKLIDSISNKKEIDFVANFYSTGAYKYNSETKTFNYINDYASPLEIVAGEEYTFDFDFGINSMNESFDWDQLKFEPNTKLGGKLSLDPTNNKKLIYTPPTNANNSDLIDSFDVSIVPNFEGKSENYVPEYKWKIKVRQVVQGAKVAYLPLSSTETNNQRIEENITRLENSSDTTIIPTDFTTQVLPNTSSIAKYEFDFVAQENDGFYLKAKWDNEILVLENGKKIFQSWKKSNGYENINFPQSLTKNQSVKYTVYVKSKDSNVFDLQYKPFNSRKLENGKWVETKAKSISKSSLVPGYKNLKYNGTLTDLVNNENLFFKERELNFSEYPEMSSWATRFNFYYSEIANSGYNFSNHNGPNWIDELKNKDGGYWEVWNDSGPNNSTYAHFDTNFSEATDISSFAVGWRTSNHPDARARTIRATVTEADGTQTVAFDGKPIYTQTDEWRINLSRSFNAVKIKLEFFNSNGTGLSFKSVSFSQDNFYKKGQTYSAYSPALMLKGGWSRVENKNDVNYSPINNTALLSKNAGDSIEFTTEAQAFLISGQKGPNTSSFDVYVDGILVAENVKTFNNKQEFDQMLFSHSRFSAKNLKVKIVNKENKPLWINYVLNGFKS